MFDSIFFSVSLFFWLLLVIESSHNILMIHSSVHFDSLFAGRHRARESFPQCKLGLLSTLPASKYLLPMLGVGFIWNGKHGVRSHSLILYDLFNKYPSCSLHHLEFIISNTFVFVVFDVRHSTWMRWCKQRELSFSISHYPHHQMVAVHQMVTYSPGSIKNKLHKKWIYSLSSFVNNPAKAERNEFNSLLHHFQY